MFAKRKASLLKKYNIFIYLLKLLFQKLSRTCTSEMMTFYRSGLYDFSFVITSVGCKEKIGRIDFLLSSLAENRMVNRRGRFAMDESNGRELARSSGRVTLKISSLLLKPDFFLVILSELRRPLRSVRFFCRFCNI